MPPYLRPFRLVPAALVLTLATAAAADDDWPQFRRDSLRSGFSRDPMPVGMTEVWNWEDSCRASAGYGVKLTHTNRPIGSCAVWKGRVYTINRENNNPYLVCADLRTGLRLWHQPLLGWGGCRPESGPAVTQAGVVFAYGRVMGTEKKAVTRTVNVRGRATQVTGVIDLPGSHVSLRAFDAVAGVPMADHPLPAGEPRTQFDPFITRLFLQEAWPWNLALLPGVGTSFGLFEPKGFGPPLVIGDRVMAASDRDLVVRWQPGQPAEMIRVSYPYVENFLDYAQQSKLQGYPLAQVDGGVIVADDLARRYLGVLGSGPRVETLSLDSRDRRVGAGTAFEWFRPMDTTIGAPTVAGDRLLMGMGGLDAQSTLAAIDPRTAALLWSYPSRSAPDHTAFRSTTWAPPISQNTGHLVGEAGPWKPGDRAAKDLGFIWTADWRSATGHLRNLGLVATDGMVYGIVRNELTALETTTGKLVWKRPIRAGWRATALVGSRDHLIVAQHSNKDPVPLLLGIDRRTGRLDWVSQLSGLGQLVPAYSMLMLCEDGKLSAYGPAERRFRMAVDSSRREDYQGDPPVTRPVAAQDGEGNPDAASIAPGVPEAPPREPTALGDAALVRLRWGTPLEEMIRLAKERKRLAPDGRLLVVMEWLDPKRIQRLPPLGGGGWSNPESLEFSRACAALAKAVEPEYLEIASEVNVYLTRRPDELEPIRALIRAARRAVAAGSERTKVLVSFNCELQSGFYGRTPYLPFGDLPDRTREARQAILTLAAEVEVVGLSTRPQAAFIQAGQVGPQYLLARRMELGGKPVLITRLEARFDDSSVPSIVQRQFLKKLFQTAYWLDALMVAYPDIRREESSGALTDATLATGSVHRPAMSEWKAALGWKWVEALTAQPPPTERTLR